MNIQTIVYLDLESTGLKESGRPRISEISLVAVNTKDFLKSQSYINDLISKKENCDKILPRILNKITLCVYPMAPVLPDVSIITGLDNYNLYGQAKFDINTVELIDSFLRRLPAPVCLVSHNGDRFDFPLLKAELDKCGGKLEHSLLCADSYIAIRSIFQCRHDILPKMSFSLINLHQRVFGCLPETSHGAEADCLTLLKVTAVLGVEFIDWVEDNYYKFRHCSAMWNMI